MKTGNTLRTAKNSLLCFFMALAGGFLVACGGDGVRFTGGGGTPTPPLSAPPVNVAILSSVEISPSPLVTDFPAYLLDTAVKGVSVSGPTGDGLTGDGGVFAASDDGVFVFSIGGTTLGSVQMSSNQMNSEVTPSDFIGLGAETDQVITIARIMQALDADGMLANGISISESARATTLDLFSAIDAQRIADTRPHSEPVTVGYIGSSLLTISSSESARNHLVATHQCLFSGGYVGDYRANGDLDDGSIERGTVYYAVEPFADRVRRFGFTVDVGALQSFEGDEVGDVGVLRAGGTETILFAESGVTITMDGLDFITPRSVDGTWNRVVNGTVAVSGTHDLAAVAGNPGATRRIVGVETTDDTEMTVAGMYVLDHFAKDNEANGGVFSGQYYSVDAGSVSILSLTLTIATGTWLESTADAEAEAALVLIGTRGEEGTTITMGIVRGNIASANENYGTFFDGSGDSDDSLLRGTWCDIGGAVGSTVAPTPQVSTLPLTAITIDWSAVEGATVYNLYRSVSVGGAYTTIATVPAADGATLSYVDRPSAGEYFHRVEYCKSDDDCSDISQGIVVEITWSAVEGATVYNLYRSTVSVGGYTQITTVVAADGVATLTTTDSRPSAVPEYFYHVQACRSDDDCSEGPPQEDPAAGGGGTPLPVATSLGECTVGLELTFEQSCSWEGYTFTVESDGNAVLFDGGVFVDRYSEAGFSRSDATRIFGAGRSGNDDGTIRLDMWRINQVGLR